MTINAIIESRNGGTLVLDFPPSIYDVYEKLQSIGIRKSPHQITFSDEDGDDVRVKLYSEDEVGKHLLLTLKEQNTLADANNLLSHIPPRLMAAVIMRGGHSFTENVFKDLHFARMKTAFLTVYLEKIDNICYNKMTSFTFRGA